MQLVYVTRNSTDLTRERKPIDFLGKKKIFFIISSYPDPVAGPVAMFANSHAG